MRPPQRSRTRFLARAACLAAGLSGAALAASACGSDPDREALDRQLLLFSTTTFENPATTTTTTTTSTTLPPATTPAPPVDTAAPVLLPPPSTIPKTAPPPRPVIPAIEQAAAHTAGLETILSDVEKALGEIESGLSEGEDKG